MIKQGEHRGIRYTIGPRKHFNGIVWWIPIVGDRGRVDSIDSGGSFYDGADDHPEGAYAWAEASVRKYIDAMHEDQWPLPAQPEPKL